MKILISFVGIVASSMVCAQSFSSGTSFTVTPMYRGLVVECTDVNKDSLTVQWNCQDERLSPVDHDYFVGPVIGADTIELNVVNAKTHALTHKVSNYIAGKSTTRFNLWQESIFQTPLLTEGLSHVNYLLKQNTKVIMTGQFDVQVNRGKTLLCLPVKVQSDRAEDCNNPETLCDQYFQQTDDCQ